MALRPASSYAAMTATTGCRAPRAGLIRGRGSFALALIGLSGLLGGATGAQAACIPTLWAGRHGRLRRADAAGLLGDRRPDRPGPGTDGSVHLAYELQIANVSDTTARLEKLEVVDPGGAAGGTC